MSFIFLVNADLKPNIPDGVLPIESWQARADEAVRVLVAKARDHMV
jgi:hypothetical protein